MFGRSLEETMAVETRLGGGYIPIFLHRCVAFLKDHGMQALFISHTQPPTISPCDLQPYMKWVYFDSLAKLVESKI